MQRRHKVLGILSWITLVLAIANAAEYFFASKDYLKKVDGKVAEVIYDTYHGNGGKYGRRRLYQKTTIKLENSSREYWLSDDAEYGGYVEANAGDSLRLYIRRWHQGIYNFNMWLNGDILYVEKNGTMLYNNLDIWKQSTYIMMFIFAGCSFIFWVMYMDVVKGKSVGHWYQRRFLAKKKT